MTHTAEDACDLANRDDPACGLHTDLRQRVVLHAADACWQPSDTPGVQRRMLQRLGPGLMQATSLVRYAPGARVHQHGHAGGVEILVLDGMFSDESGDHPAGTYLRKPPGTRHVPHSHAGCLLFVKLGGFAPGDTAGLRLNTHHGAGWEPGMTPGINKLPLHEHAGVRTMLLRSDPHTWYDTHSHPGGEELLVLDGVLHDDMGTYTRHSWIRNPRWSRHAPHTGDEGALYFVKVGHLGLVGGSAAGQPSGASEASDV